MDGWQVDHGTQYFTARSPKFIEEVERWQQNGWVQAWAMTPWMVKRESFEPSPDDQARYVGSPTMNAMVHGLSEGIELYVDTRVDRLEKQDDQWRLWDHRGEHYGNFDAVVLTAPLAQTMALLPEGSAAEASMRTANMTPTWAIALALEEASGIEANGLFSNDGIVTWASKDSSKPGRPNQYETWLIHFSPNWTSNHLDAAEDLLHHQALQFLEKLAGKPVSVHDSFRHRWLHARSGSMEVSIPQWDAKQHIGLAGDWTMGSRLEDAWLSAQQLADQIEAEFA
jgi:predicted NAD/FAD-dependent oxidoreductase